MVLIGSVDLNYLSVNTLLDNIISQWQEIMNRTYNCNLVIDGVFGSHCKSEALNHYLYYKDPLISNNHVLFMQKLLNQLGYTVCEDSIFGLNCKEKTIEFQKDYNLLVDGCIGPEVSEKLLSLNN